MKHIMRITVFLLLFSMVASLYACSDNNVPSVLPNETGTSATEAETEDGNPPPALPDENYNGESFTFLLRLTNYAYDEIFVYTEDLDGEVVNDAIFNRNRQVEEKFNIKIVGNMTNDVIGIARKSIAAGENGFDALWESKNAMPSLITSGYLVDFNTIPYINLDAQYWDKNAHAQLSVAGKLYMMPCDISMQNLTGARFLYFNKKLITDYNLQNPYDLVHSNKWVLDEVLNMIKSISVDLNGDGVMDRNDRFGMLSEGGASNGNILYFIKSAGIRNTTNDTDGIPQISFMTDKTVSIMDKCREVLENPDYCITYERAAKDADLGDFPHIFVYCRTALFTADHFLFVQNGIQESDSFKDMQSDYGIAPNPKYDSSQENYHHRIDPYTTGMAIPVTNTNPERTGVILEYMSWLSSKTLLPAYYETTIKTKRARDEEAPAILDIIKGSISYEISDIFDVGITSVIWTGYAQNNISSAYAKSEKSIQKKLEKLIADFTKE